MLVEFEASRALELGHAMDLRQVQDQANFAAIGLTLFSHGRSDAQIAISLQDGLNFFGIYLQDLKSLISGANEGARRYDPHEVLERDRKLTPDEIGKEVESTQSIRTFIKESIAAINSGQLPSDDQKQEASRLVGIVYTLGDQYRSAFQS